MRSFVWLTILCFAACGDGEIASPPPRAAIGEAPAPPALEVVLVRGAEESAARITPREDCALPATISWTHGTRPVVETIVAVAPPWSLAIPAADPAPLVIRVRDAQGREFSWQDHW